MCLFINFTHFMAGIPAEILPHIPAGISRMSVLVEHQTRIALRVCLLKERPHLLLIKLHVKILGEDFFTHAIYPYRSEPAYELIAVGIDMDRVYA